MRFAQLKVLTSRLALLCECYNQNMTSFFGHMGEISGEEGKLHCQRLFDKIVGHNFNKMQASIYFPAEKSFTTAGRAKVELSEGHEFKARSAVGMKQTDFGPETGHG